ncbi:R-spondin-3 isoform X1 [Polypterus senegalus]|uniref:R-spondin-3 isoform X1 n=2 Tax=Polypterus senegalus TaxID=55291 RepID=UPI0019637470|nr:R-spondin-3 isoform X1 [Polypterus senegalus]
MQLRLLSLVLIFVHFMEYSDSQHASRSRRQRRTHPGVSHGCQGGCATCSDYNGCLSCKPKMFFFLERNGMKQIGVCLPACPSGYHGSRSPEINKCLKCKADCDACFEKNFCTKCKAGFYLHMGRCLEICPEEFEPNDQLMECIPVVHCIVGEWSQWTPCSKRGKTCGFKRGEESRSREVVRQPSTRGDTCPVTTEKRTCVVKRKKCRKAEKRGKEERRKRPAKGENHESRHDERDTKRDTDTRGASENKNKTEHRRKKAQGKHHTSTAGSSGH